MTTKPTLLFAQPKLAPKYLRDLHDDFVKKKVSYKKYKQLEREYVKNYDRSMEDEASDFLHQTEFEKARAAYWPQSQTIPEYQKKRKKR